ncbi:hypothetical protein MNBD_NITROSPINAE02-1080 [hydrothermal vent metagenome]|uniref:Type II secretion envelope pseudopilin protein (PulG,guides folded protein to PulD in outer membrane) n=1 Tax=hydrothermal vent metagenome TaxID=652676 RepID=A0A3B1C3D0_9ZZZZ
MPKIIRTTDAGFTVIEVIMVIVILGILAIIAIPKYLDINESSGKAAYFALKQSLEAHAAQIYADCAARGEARYPSAASVLISGNGKPGDCMEKAMPDSGFKITALSPTDISILIDGDTQNYRYNPLSGEVSGGYN